MEKLSKPVAKLIKSLQIKKYRNKEQLFLVQGDKSFREVLHSSFQIEIIIGTAGFYSDLPEIQNTRCRKFVANERELESMGSFSSNNSVIAAVKIPEPRDLHIQKDEKILVLDDIRDPGNFGTLIRTADWFGIRKIVASMNSVDVFNPKVINSTMGSFVRVMVHYVDLEEFFTKRDFNIYLADMNGKDIHDIRPHDGCLIVLGNESNGVSTFWNKLQHIRISIPGANKAESLNVSVAGGILMNWATNN